VSRGPSIDTDAVALLRRFVKYAVEDRATTARATRLARLVDETRRFLDALDAEGVGNRGALPVAGRFA
jgi:hypothetical protein